MTYWLNKLVQCQKERRGENKSHINGKFENTKFQLSPKDNWERTRNILLKHITYIERMLREERFIKTNTGLNSNKIELLITMDGKIYYMVLFFPNFLSQERKYLIEQDLQILRSK